MAGCGERSGVLNGSALSASAHKGGLQRLEREEIVGRDLQRLVAYWDALRGDRAMPDRAEIRPEELAFILGRLMLVEVHRGSENLSFRFRLVGTLIEDAGHQGLQGRWARDLQPDFYRDAVTQAYAEAATSGKPNFYRIRYEMGDQRLRYERVTLPLAAGGNQADLLLVGTRWDAVNHAFFEAIPALGS